MYKLDQWLAALALRICFFGNHLVDHMAKDWQVFFIRCLRLAEYPCQPRVCSFSYLMNSQMRAASCRNGFVRSMSFRAFLMVADPGRSRKT